MDKKVNDYLQHWGIKGMRWGNRRYQNKDGSLTPLGRKRYADDNRDFVDSGTDGLGRPTGSKAKSGDTGWDNMDTVPGRKPLFGKKQKGKDKVDKFIEKDEKKKKSTDEEDATKKKKSDDNKDADAKPDTTKTKSDDGSGNGGNNNSSGNGGNNNSSDNAKKKMSANDYKEAGKAGITTGNLVKNQGVDIAKQVRKIKNANEMEDYKSMSNAELKAKVDRIRLENDYVNVSMAKTTAAQQKVEGILSIVGGTLVVAGTGLSIYGSIKKIRDGD